MDIGYQTMVRRGDERGEHTRQIPHTQQCLLARRNSTRDRQDRIHDDKPGAWSFESRQDVLQDGCGFRIWPVMENHAHKIDVGILDRLRFEEVVRLAFNTGADRFG